MKSLKELRAELKKAMPSPSKMSRDEVVLMLEKHKGDAAPKKKLVAEHKELVDVLEKPTAKKLKMESVKQEKELKELTKVKKETPVKSKRAVKMPESDDEKPVAKKTVKKPVKMPESDEEKPVKKPREDKSSSGDSVDKKKAWGMLRKEGLSSAQAWAKLRG